MKITKELLQQYELGQCSPEEERAVRLWLDSDSWEDEVFDESLVKDSLGREIWSKISPPDVVSTKILLPQVSEGGFWVCIRPWFSVAALLILSIGLSWFFYANKQDYHFESKNTDAGLKWMRKNCFDLALSENSSANINLRSGNLLLSGGMILKPKCDMVLHDRQNNIALDFREGEIYFISRDPDTSRLIVLRRSELSFLPPIIQRQLKKQFHIT